MNNLINKKASVFTKACAIFAIFAMCEVHSFADSAKLTTGQSFALDDKMLPDGREMTYVCVRGSVCDTLIEEIPSRDYSQRGLPIEGAIVWLKRNPRIQGKKIRAEYLNSLLKTGC